MLENVKSQKKKKQEIQITLTIIYNTLLTLQKSYKLNNVELKNIIKNTYNFFARRSQQNT